jgi:hypothetical protein
MKRKTNPFLIHTQILIAIHNSPKKKSNKVTERESYLRGLEARRRAHMASADGDGS